MSTKAESIGGFKAHGSFSPGAHFAPFVSRTHRLLGIFSLALIYFIVARFALSMDQSNRFALLIWPPSGVAVASVLLFGVKLWPGIVLGALFANWLNGAHFLVATGIGFGNALESIVAFLLLKKLDFHLSIERLKDVFNLIFFAVVGTLVSAIIGSTCLYFGGIIDAPHFYSSLKTWWFGDMMSVLVVTPLILTWSNGGILRNIESKKILEFVLLFTFFLLGSFLIFTDYFYVGDITFPRPYLIFPMMMLAAIRFGQPGTTLGQFILAAVTVTAAVSGHVRFWGDNLDKSIVHIQVFLMIVIGTKMVLAAALTERKEERDELQSSNVQRQAILNASLDSIVTMNEVGSIMEFNPAAEKIFGYRREEVLGKEMAPLIIPPRFQEAHRIGLKRYLSTGIGPVIGPRIPMMAMKSDGSEFPIEISIVPLTVEGQIMFIGFIQDVTEKKRDAAEKKLAEESEKFLAGATHILSESIDFHTTLKHVAEAAVPNFGDWCIVQILDETGKSKLVEYSCSIPELKPHLETAIDLYFVGAEGPTVTASVIKSKQPRLITDFDLDVYRKLGASEDQVELAKKLRIRSMMSCPIIFHGQVQGAITLGASDSNIHYGKREMTVFEELSRRAAIAIENSKLFLDAKEAIYARDEFLSVASHELKTPLTSLSLLLQMFNRQAKKILNDTPHELHGTIRFPVKMVNSISDVEAQSRRLTALLEELLDLTRIRLGRMELVREKIELCTLVNQIIDRFKIEAASKSISITSQCTQSVTGNWDRVRIEQVVSNLISNAIKYGNGKPIDVSVEQEGEVARFVVKDQGLGIPEELREKIFERFERAHVSGKKISGLGLGLYISRQIINAHGGVISVESIDGKGSAFKVELPKNLKENMS